MTQPTNGPDINAGQVDGQKPEEKDNKDHSFASIEDAVAELRRVRAENAQRRVKTREDEERLKEYETWKQSQMSEAEKIAAERDKLKADLRGAYVDVYAEKYGVPGERIKFVIGDTREEIEEAAKVLGVKSGPEANTGQVPPTQQTSSPPNLFPGSRGTPVGSSSDGKTTDFNAILRDQLRKA
jgi:hypothetical protein